jgi:acyl carrier protein
MSAIETKVKMLAAEFSGFGTGSIQAFTRIVGDGEPPTCLGMDSLDEVEWVMLIEESFDIELPDEHAAKLATIGDYVRYVNKALARQDAEMKDRSQPESNCTQDESGKE